MTDQFLWFQVSNEQLQQELKYTLLKPDCHSWWISKMQSDTLQERYAIKLCLKLGKKATETYGILQTAFRPSCMNRASVFEWHKRFKEGTESVGDDERCERSKEVNTRELIGQRVRVRVRVTMLRFLGSSGRDSLGRGQHLFKSGQWQFPARQCISPQLPPCHKLFDQDGHLDSSSASLSSKTMLPVTIVYSLSSQAVVMRQLRKWKRLWRRSLTRSHKRISMGPFRSCWNGRTSALQPEEITSKGTRVSCVYYQ